MLNGYGVLACRTIRISGMGACLLREDERSRLRGRVVGIY